jgi:hypothetical protein
VNSYTTGLQARPAVAADVDGNFVVVWADANEFVYGLRYDIVAQRYDAAGFPLGGQFRVNTYTTYSQGGPKVAAAADGGFSVVWHSSRHQDGDSWGVFGQLYDAAGVAQGVEFQANTYTSRYQEQPAVASNPDGDLVVAWQSYQDNGSYGGSGIYAQRFGDPIFQDGFEAGDTGNWSSVRSRRCR